METPRCLMQNSPSAGIETGASLVAVSRINEMNCRSSTFSSTPGGMSELVRDRPEGRWAW